MARHSEILWRSRSLKAGVCAPLIVPVLKVRLSQQWTGEPQEVTGSRGRTLMEDLRPFNPAPMSQARHGDIPDDNGVRVGLRKDTELPGT